MEEKKKKLNLSSFAAGITAGGLIMIAGSITSLMNKADGWFTSLLISIVVVLMGLLLHKWTKKKNTK